MSSPSIPHHSADWAPFLNRGLLRYRPDPIKRSADLLVASAVLSLGLPLLAVVALLVWMSSPGRLFYVQRRLGRGYRTFGCIKFRTMVAGADRKLRLALKGSDQLREEYARDFKLKHDPRITPIGKLLRRTSLDELPQFWNILRGDMSLVGPRPIVKKEIAYYGDAMDDVMTVRPGLTGLWQTSGRNNLSYQQRVALDLHYVHHRSFWLDLRILWKTIAVVLWPTDKGAY